MMKYGYVVLPACSKFWATVAIALNLLARNSALSCGNLKHCWYSSFQSRGSPSSGPISSLIRCKMSNSFIYELDFQWIIVLRLKKLFLRTESVNDAFNNSNCSLCNKYCPVLSFVFCSLVFNMYDTVLKKSLLIFIVDWRISFCFSALITLVSNGAWLLILCPGDLGADLVRLNWCDDVNTRGVVGEFPWLFAEVVLVLSVDCDWDWFSEYSEISDNSLLSWYK